MNNSLGNGYVEPEHFDQYAPRLHELSDPSKVREDSFPVRLLSKNPLMAWGPMTEDALHNIAAHAKDAVELAIPEMAMGGVRKEHIKRAQKLTTLKKAVKSLPSYQEHAMFDGPIPTGSHVVEAIHSQSGRPHTVLRKAGYDAIDHDPIITGTRILDPSIIHPWDLAPTPMPVPSAPSIRKLRPISPLVAQAIGRHIISRGGHDQ